MRFFIGLLIIIIGILLIANGFSYNFFYTLVINFSKFWPVLFIIIGISIMSSIKGFGWLKYLNMVVAILFVILLLFVPSDMNVGIMKEDSFNVDISGENLVYMDFDVPRLKINVVSDENINEIKGKYRVSLSDFRIDKIGNRIKFRSDDDSWMRWSRDSSLELELPSNVRYVATFNAGIVDLDTDINENIFERMDFNGGIVRINYSADGFDLPLKINITGGIVDGNLYVPDKTTYYKNITGGLRHVDVDDKMVFERDNPDVMIDVSGGISNFGIKRK
jgi:hypothetical protein